VNDTPVLDFNIETHSIEKFDNILTQNDGNIVFYLAGSTINAVGKTICPDCLKFITAQNLPDIKIVNKWKTFTNESNQGGLKNPCFQVLLLLLHCELYFAKYKNYLIRYCNKRLIQHLTHNLDIRFPTCCYLKEKLIKHFFTVRSFCVKNFSENYRKRKIVYGTASVKRKRT